MICGRRYAVLAVLVSCLFLAGTKLHAQVLLGEQHDAVGVQSQTSSQDSGTQKEHSAQQAPQTQVPTVTKENGEEDQETERLIQQIQATSGDQESGPPRPGTNVALGRDEVLIRADEQEKVGDLYKVRGHVEIRFRTYIMHSDQATYDATTGLVTATGHVVFDGGPHNEHLTGTHATYDVSRDLGTFYDVSGSTGLRVKNNVMFLTSSTPFFFTGKVVQKLGPDLYRVNHGYITSCQLPKPKWQFEAGTATVEVGDEARMHHAILKIKGIPVFYFPYVQHPVNNLGRKTGFLIPEIGQSNVRGFIFGDGFYWAINRSSDATIGASIYSKIGSAEFGEYRAVGYKYRFHAQYFGVIDDKGPPVLGQNPGGQEVKTNGFIDLPGGFRGVVATDYLSTYLFRLRFALSYIEAILSEVRSTGFVFKNWNGYGIGFMGARYQNYESLAPGDYIDIAHIPTVEFSSVERSLAHSPFVYAYDVAAEGVSRHEIGFQTAPEVGRLDAAPYVALPAIFHGWTVRPQGGFRETFWSQRLEPAAGSLFGVAVSTPINRNAFSGSLEVKPPALSRIYGKKLFGTVVKHTIEPLVTYRYESGVENFSNIIRFDQRDILSDTNEVEYGVVNRLFSKRTKSTAECFQAESRPPSSAATSGKKLEPGAKSAPCDDHNGPAREVITWELAQKYFFNPNFGGALVPETRNVFTTTVDFSGIAFLTEPRRFSPIISRLRLQDAASDLQWALDYDPVLHQINASSLFAGHHFGPWYVSGGETYMRLPAEVGTSSLLLPAETVNQYRVMLLYGNMSRKGFSGAVNVGVDAKLSYVQGSTVQANYNWDCCGTTFLYTRFDPGAGLKTENAYRFTFSLTNVGSFGSIRRLQRLY